MATDINLYKWENRSWNGILILPHLHTSPAPISKSDEEKRKWADRCVFVSRVWVRKRIYLVTGNVGCLADKNQRFNGFPTVDNGNSLLPTLSFSFFTNNNNNKTIEKRATERTRIDRFSNGLLPSINALNIIQEHIDDGTPSTAITAKSKLTNIDAKQQRQQQKPKQREQRNEKKNHRRKELLASRARSCCWNTASTFILYDIRLVHMYCHCLCVPGEKSIHKSSDSFRLPINS